MKSYLVIVLSLALIANSNCGLIDGFFGTVKDTTSSITHHVGGALHYGKNLVFGGSEQNAAGEVVNKPGIVGTISLKIHGVSETVREEVRTILHIFDGDQAKDGSKGIFGRLLDKIKGRVFKIKSFLFGNENTRIKNGPNMPIKPLNNDTTAIRHKLRKYFFNDASANSGFRQTLNSLQEAINRARQNITKKTQESGNENTEHDGSGLLDIRASVDNLAGGVQNDFKNGVDAGYDKVNDAMDEGRQSAQSSLRDVQRNTNNFIENQKSNIQNQYNKFGDSVNKFKSDVSNSINDSIDNQRKNAQDNYKQFSNNADTIKNDVANTVNDNADKLRSDVDSSISDIGARLGDESSKVKELMENGYRKVDFES